MAHIGEDEKLYLEWDDVNRQSFELGRSVQQASLANPLEAPSRIINIPRGGLHVVNFLSRMLGMSSLEIVSINATRYSRDHPTMAGKIKIGQLPDRSLIEGHHVLVPDEVYDTGETFEKVTDVCYGLGAASVKTAALYYKPENDLFNNPPDFYVDEAGRWIVFPWEPLDDEGDVFQVQLAEAREQALSLNGHLNSEPIPAAGD